MAKSKYKRTRLPAWSCMLACLFANAQAAEITAEFSVGIGTSDNIARTATNEIDENLGLLGLQFDLREDTRRLRASIRADFDYIYYEDNTFDDELVGGLDALLDITLVEERLTWLVQDNFGQQLSDPFEASQPGNREDVNFFTTGPSLSLPLGARNAFGIDLRYSKINYETQPFDNERVSATVSFGRSISRESNLSINVTEQQVEFDDAGASPDFDTREAFLRFENNDGRNQIGLDIGYTEVDVAAETSDGFLLRLDWSHDISPFSTFSVNGGTRYSDQGDIFRFTQGRGSNIGDTVDTEGEGAPFKSNFAGLGYRLDRDRTQFNLSASWREEDFEGRSDRDRDLLRFDLAVSRDMSRRTFVRLELRFERRDYTELDRDDDDSRASLTFGYRFTPALNVSIEYQYFKRSSDNSLAEYDENRAFLRFGYIPRWGR